MRPTRRTFLATTAAMAGTVTILPMAARAAAHASDMFKTDAGDITVHTVQHASFALETPSGTIYSDPVGDPALYADLPRPDLILITHEHGDHFNVDTLTALAGDGVKIITNGRVFEKMPEALQAKAMAMGNGESADFNGLKIDAIPAYNITEGRTGHLPKGRDNGYILNFPGFRVYISGDTEDTPEMRALTDIGLCFLCMNLPFTMDVKQAASAVAAFKPAYVYPYHYRGRDGGTQDPAEFAALVGDAAKVEVRDWYAES